MEDTITETRRYTARERTSVPVRIDPPVVDRLRKMAWEQDCSQADLIRKAINLLLANYEKT